MTLLSRARLMVRNLGLEVQRYDENSNPILRTVSLLRMYDVDTVLDIGANDGGYARELRACGYEGNILSFEPLEDAHAALLLASKKDPNWSVADRMAIGDEVGMLTINIAGNSKSSSMLDMLPSHTSASPESKFVGIQSCAVNRLDELAHPVLNQANRVFLKIDTQGFELAVYRGAKRIMSQIIGVQCELSTLPLYKDQPLYEDMLKVFSEDGFDLWNIIPGFSDPHTKRLLQFDGVFFKT